MTDVVVFIDALSPRELGGVLNEWCQGHMDSGVPRVTPRVMSSIYTGLPPEENGMLEVSRHGGENVGRPRASTIMEQAVRSGKRVLSMGMPFCVPWQVTADELVVTGRPSVLHGDAMQEDHTVPNTLEALVRVPPPQADYINDHPDVVYGSAEDHTWSYFSRFKETLRAVKPDVAFVGYRLIDSYCHFQHTEQRDGRPYRRHLIEVVAHLLERIDRHVDGDVMFFSDHGQTELTDVFRVNAWLRERGWLDYKVDYDFVDTFTEYQEGEQHPVDRRVENQLVFGQPGVTLNEGESVAVSADPFDSCLTLLCDRDGFDEEALRDDLMATGMYRSVDYKWELYDEGARFYDRMPDVIPDRAEGVFVSGNLHREPIGMGYYRTGVHDRTACYGATRPLDAPDDLNPEGMYHVLRDFIGLETVPSPVAQDQLETMTDEEMTDLRRSLEDLGVSL